MDINSILKDANNTLDKKEQARTALQYTLKDKILRYARISVTLILLFASLYFVGSFANDTIQRARKIANAKPSTVIVCVISPNSDTSGILPVLILAPGKYIPNLTQNEKCTGVAFNYLEVVAGQYELTTTLPGYAIDKKYIQVSPETTIYVNVELL
jgi:hypothetical protein